MLEFELTFNVTEYAKQMPKGVSTTPHRPPKLLLPTISGQYTWVQPMAQGSRNDGKPN
jgi:hypothetical protein